MTLPGSGGGPASEERIGDRDLGHHWLADVAMGWVLGLAWVTAVVTAHRAWITARRHRERPGQAAAAAENTSGNT